MKRQYKDTIRYKTKDNSEIRELLHPDNNIGVKNQSLAEATVVSGQKTTMHYHRETEEIYYISKGKGVMFLDKASFDVSEGDSVLIMPGKMHCIENTGNSELKFLCCCSPAYQHDDTYLFTDK